MNMYKDFCMHKEDFTSLATWPTHTHPYQNKLKRVSSMWSTQHSIYGSIYGMVRRILYKLYSRYLYVNNTHISRY